MMQAEFNSMVTGKLENYVYALADSRDTRPLKDRIFYVGKGSGNRCFNHAKVEKGLGEEPLYEGRHKLSIIRSIRANGGNVDVLIIKHGLSEKDALALEAVLIPLIGLSNEKAGHDSQLLWLNQVQVNELYDNPIQRRDTELFQRNVLFVNLSQQKRDTIVAGGVEVLSKVTLGAWTINSAMSQRIDFIVGVKDGLVVSIFELEKNLDETTKFERVARSEKGKHERSQFFGSQREDLEHIFRGRSFHDNAEILSKFGRRGKWKFVEAIRGGQ